jgi:predicted Zn-dependent protease
MDRIERGRALMKKLKKERAEREKKQALKERMKKRVEADKKKQAKQVRPKVVKQNTTQAKQTQAKQTQAKQTRQPKRKKLNVKKPKPQLFRDNYPTLSMEGEFIPPQFRYDTPSYDIASGKYVNQKNVKCWTRYNKGGNPYTTCKNTDYDLQLRRRQPPDSNYNLQGKVRKPTARGLRNQKKELKPTNREPDLNYILL